MVDPSGNLEHQLEKQSLSSPSNLIYISIEKYRARSLLQLVFLRNQLKMKGVMNYKQQKYQKGKEQINGMKYNSIIILL